MSDSLTRRDFVKLSALVGGGAAALAACGRSARQTVTSIVNDPKQPPWEEQWHASVCVLCPGGCGVLVRTVGGDAKKLEGNPAHPVNRGRLCARGQAGVQVLYHPDRVRTPLRRTGTRGRGEFTAISWEEALAELAEKLGGLGAAGQAHTVLGWTRPLRGSLAVLFEHFFRAYRSPNLFSYQPFSDEVLLEANRRTTGHRAFVGVDLENANYLLSFSAAFLEAGRSPVRMARGFGHFRQGRPGMRGRFVQVEPRLSLTAANADEWVYVPPGTEAHLVLAFAHVILREELQDRDFIARHTRGFEAFQRWVLSEFSPEQVSEPTGVPTRRIERLAREFARQRPALALAGDAATAHTHGLFAALAVNALNALVGAYGNSGGLFFDPAPPFTPLAAVRPASRRPPLAPHPADLPEAILHGEPYSVEALLLYGANPAYELPGRTTRQALEKIPFIASFSSFLDDTTAYADLVLPDSSFLERWSDDVPAPGSGVATATLGPPVVAPLDHTRASGDVLLELARRLGGRVAKSLPWQNFESFLQTRWRGLQQARRGSIRADSFGEFWSRAVEAGGWWDDKHPAFAFATASGKFEFPRAAGGAGARESAQASFAGEPAEFPFHLHVFAHLALGDGASAHLPWLQELTEPMSGTVWTSWVELNPKTAIELGIRDGELVWVESPQGKLRLRAKLLPGAAPTVVSIPAGQGHEFSGRYARQRGANVFSIVVPQRQAAMRTLAWAATRVKVYRA